MLGWGLLMCVCCLFGVVFTSATVATTTTIHYHHHNRLCTQGSSARLHAGVALKCSNIYSSLQIYIQTFNSSALHTLAINQTVTKPHTIIYGSNLTHACIYQASRTLTGLQRLPHARRGAAPVHCGVGHHVRAGEPLTFIPFSSFVHCSRW